MTKSILPLNGITLAKIDRIWKGRKSYTNHTFFLILAGLLSPIGIDIGQYVEHVELIYVALTGLHSAIGALCRTAMDDKRRMKDEYFS